MYGALPAGFDAASGLCSRTGVYNAPTLANWSAVEDYAPGAGTFKTAEGTFIDPFWHAACAHASAQSIWAGLGGDSKYTSSTRLDQAGVDTNQSGLNNSQPFFEYVNQDPSTGVLTGVPEQDFTSWYVQTGDTVHVYVNYSSSNGGTLTFRVTDGTHSTPVVVTGKSGFYDGYTAETANERPMAPVTDLNKVNGSWYYLRQGSQPNGPNNYTDWTKMMANGFTMTGATYAHRYINMQFQKANGDFDTLLANPTAVSSSANTYSDKWDSCS
ncbi:MAG TPA: G1 family glutamic endopeptidase [Mycobacteriales bacterium]|nr:G1 family glutamic endopeptidase [Mycobacteriales bacterium]